MQTLELLSKAIPQSWLRLVIRTRSRSKLARWCSGWLASALRDRIVGVPSGPAKSLLFNTGGTAANFGLPSYEPDLLHALLLLLEPGMTFFDVGACFGFLSLVAARAVGTAGTVVAFEPVAENSSVLQRNAELNGFSNLTLLPFALCNYDGQMEFYATDNPFVGALVEVGRAPRVQSPKVIVDARRLDTLFPEAGVPKPDVVKIDVEGAEAAVLSGAYRTIAEFRPVLLIELHGSSHAVATELYRNKYAASLFGSSQSVADAYGTIHIVAVPRDRPDCDALLRTFRDPAFPRCDRCAMSVPSHDDTKTA